VQAWLVDAFADERFAGNPAAVLVCDGFPDTHEMQAVAASLDVPTTAFVVPSGPAQYRIRWFAPRAELALCGHATLASAAYLRQVIGDASDVLHFMTEQSGPLLARRVDDGFSIDLPRMDALPCASIPGLEEALGARIVQCSRASDDIVVELGSELTVANLRPKFADLARFDCRGHVVTARADRGRGDFVSRAFFPALGVDEDQVCVSAHCKLTPYWAQRLGKQRLEAFQLSRRGGRLSVELVGDRVIVAGTAIVRGTTRVSAQVL